MPIRADVLGISMCRIRQMVVRIIPDASRSTALFDLHGQCGILWREGSHGIVAKVARKYHIPHIVPSFSHRPGMEIKRIGLSHGV